MAATGRNSDHLASYADTFHIIQQYVTSDGPQALEKFSWKNSIGLYRWQKRAADQPAAAS
jgi:hypothetical protein